MRRLRAQIRAQKVTRYLTALLLTFCGLASLPALAALDLNGVAIHNELGEDQFIAALYLENLSSDSKTILLSNQRKRMEIKVLANRLLSRRFKRLWIEGIAINANNDDLKKHAQNLADFSNMLKIQLVKNDTLTIERTFRRGVEVSINGLLLGTINDDSFFDIILRTWIGPVPLSTTLKTELLKGGSVDPNLLSNYEKIRTTPERASSLKLAISALATAAPNLPDATQISAASQSSVASSKAVQVTSVAVASSTQSSAISSTPKVTAVSSEVAIAPTPSSSSSTKALPNQILGNEIFDDDEEKDFSYTAADLLTQQLYVSKLTRWTGDFVSYPKSSQRKNEQGTVRVTVTIDRKGRVTYSEVVAASEHQNLNKAALKAIKKASPYPEIPSVITGENFTFTVPIVFALR